MATILLAVITILLTLILIVLVHHIPKEEWSALLNLGLRICWALLIVLVAVSQVAITIVWEARPSLSTHEIFLAQSIPFFFFFLSGVPFAILNPDHNKRWEAVRLAVKSTLLAFAFPLFAWWDPIPPSPTIEQFTKEFEKRLPGVLLAWVWALVVVAFVAKIIRVEWPSLVAPTTTTEVVVEPSER